MQRALIQYRDPKLYDLVEEALRKAGRTDLIGYGPKCLIRPRIKAGHAEQPARSRAAGQAKNAGRSKNADRANGADSRKVQPERKRKKKTIRNIHKKK